MTRHLIIGLFLLSATAPASAEAPRDFCPDRPGLGTPACTIDAHHVAVEVGLADWTLERSDGSRTDTLVAGDLLLRYGLSDSLEVQLGWPALGVVRHRSPNGAVDHTSGTGDLRVALRQNLRNPDGSDLSLAVMPFVTLPIGGAEIGESDWTAGVVLPVSYELSDSVQIAVTGEIDAAADQADGGHHLAYTGIFGLDAALGKYLSVAFELAAERDEEQDGSSALLTGLSIAWLANPDVQLDAGANVGLAGEAPDLELYVGLARRF